MMKVEQTEIDGVLLITPARFADERGYFSETYNQQRFQDAGVTARFMQDNQSRSDKPGTVRGLHYQAPPFAQAKLVRVLQGAIIDVAVDARNGSPTYSAHIKRRLTAELGEQLFIPAGFLHGFVTLEPETIVAYKVDAPYDRASDGAVLWNDADLGIDWGLDPAAAVLSDKDAAALRWRDFKSPF